VAEYRRHGKAGLKKAGRAGRKPQMDQEDRERLHNLLLKGPKALGDKTHLWTSVRVSKLIEREFGVRYHSGHVWKILVSLGWSLQPVGLGQDGKEHETMCWKSNV
jgi:transposase